MELSLSPAGSGFGSLLTPVTTILGRSPTDASLIPATVPAIRLLVGIDNYADGTVEVQLYSPAGYTTISGDLVAWNNTAYTVIRPAAPLTPGIAYLWRVRFGVLGGLWLSWSHWRMFTVGQPTDGGDLRTGSWTVLAAPYGVSTLWFAQPPAGTPGDTVVAYGMRLDELSTGTVTASVAGVDSGGATLTPVAGTADALTGDRVIDTVTGRCDPEHDEVSFTLPAVDPPGGPLLITGVP